MEILYVKMLFLQCLLCCHMPNTPIWFLWISFCHLLVISTLFLQAENDVTREEVRSWNTRIYFEKWLVYSVCLSCFELCTCVEFIYVGSWLLCWFVSILLSSQVQDIAASHCSALVPVFVSYLRRYFKFSEHLQSLLHHPSTVNFFPVQWWTFV